MKRVAVYCASSTGARPTYGAAARAMGHALARRNLDLVYGGGSVGLMGLIADATLEKNGHVIGVITEQLMQKEVGHRGLPDLRVVKTMHERKALMHELADAFIALPGSYGTLEELAEILAWGTLGLHAKPFGLLNTEGYYDHFLAFLDHAMNEQLMKPRHRAIVLVSTDPDDLLTRMGEWQSDPTPKWPNPPK